ncbi:DUF1735 domain-containing protein [Tamlana fucoidanivorans]|nr:DUF1735 domain-containing protein [Tamlana fucoidanivorans]
MKKVVLLICIGSLFLLQACYEDYKEDYIYSATYFARQYPIRTLVDEADKDMTLEIGAVLGGKYSNDVNERASFIIQDTLLNADNYPQFTKLPDNYYTLKSNDIVIPSGQFKGSTTMTINKDLFLNDPLAIGNNYALPIEMTESTADTILHSKRYSVVVIKYFNQYHGWYYVKGVDTNTSDNTSVTYSNDDLVLNEDVLLQTTSKNELTVPYVGNPDVSGRNMNFSIDTDGSVIISEDNVTGTSGTGSYDSNTRNFTLDYSYTDGDGAVHTVKDTLIYRNTELILEEWN